MDKSQPHAFVHFLLAFRESRMESSRFVGKLRTKARYTLLLLFLARSLPEVIQGLTSLCHPTAG